MRGTPGAKDRGDTRCSGRVFSQRQLLLNVEPDAVQIELWLQVYLKLLCIPNI